MSILEEIADCVISGRLQEIFLSDPEYQDLSRKQEQASEEMLQQRAGGIS